MVEYKNKKWEIFATRNMSFFHESLEIPGATNYAHIFLTIPRNHIAIITEYGTRTTIYNNTEILQKYGEKIKEICYSRKIDKLINIYKKYGDDLIVKSIILEKEFSQKNFLVFCKSYQRMTPSLALTASLGRVMYQELLEILHKKFPLMPSQKIDSIIGKVTCPSEHTPLLDSQISILKIGEFIQKNNISNWDKNYKVVSIISKHLDKYSHIPVNFNEDSWNKDEIINQIKGILNLDCDCEIKKLVSSHNKRIKQAKEKLIEINDKKITKIAKSIQIGTILNEYRKNVFCRASLAYRPLFIQIAKKYKLDSWKSCWCLTFDEIKKLFFNNDKSIIKEIPSRKKVGLVYSQKNGLGFLPKNILEKFLSDSKLVASKTDDKIEQTNIIKGTIANNGKVKGKVKIILSKNDFHKFQNGDIIVTHMTSVDFVPIMKLASAFITNEGGITSHASIVSREMNKPCIIGTKIATKVLRDGDYVEVNADTGIITKLKDAK